MRRRDGIAIKIKIILGRIVQIISIVCPSNKYRWDNLFIIIDKIRYEIRIVIIVKIIMVWSWK